MKKKSARKLDLNRETLHRLESARGGAITVTITVTLPPNFTKGYCDSVASCSALAEDCCVVGAANDAGAQNIG